MADNVFVEIQNRNLTIREAKSLWMVRILGSVPLMAIALLCLYVLIFGGIRPMAEGWKRYAGISVLAFCYCAFVGFPLYLAYTMLARHLILATDSTISRHISLLGLRLRTRIYPKHSFQSLNMNEVKRGPFGGVRLQVLSLVGPKDDLELAAFEEADKAASVAHLISGFLELPLEVKGSRN